jgi:hypothetical protein
LEKKVFMWNEAKDTSQDVTIERRVDTLGFAFESQL